MSASPSISGVMCFPPTDAFFFFRLHEPRCARRGFVLLGLLPFLPTPEALCPRATSFGIMHDFEEKLRCLELDLFIAAAFDVAHVSFLQNRIPPHWLDTVLQVP